jgi:hypothetical protein
MENKMIKVIALTNNLILISQIEEVGVDIGEPDCKLIKPFVVTRELSINTLEPYLCGYTKQDTLMISSDKIVTLADPTPTLLEKYEDLIKE